jgi:hypothetical protein
MWRKEKQKSLDDLKHCLCSAPVLSFPYVQQPFRIETNAFDYVVGAVLTHHEHMMSYHYGKLSDIFHKYPTYDHDQASLCSNIFGAFLIMIVEVGKPQKDLKLS